MALRVMLVEDTVGVPMVKVLNKWGYEVSLHEKQKTSAMSDLPQTMWAVVCHGPRDYRLQ